MRKKFEEFFANNESFLLSRSHCTLIIYFHTQINTLVFVKSHTHKFIQRILKFKINIFALFFLKNVTRSRVVKFCCPDYEEFEFEGKKICKSNATTTTTTIKPLVSLSKHDNVSSTTPLVSTEKNPYMNYSGEYGKDFNHYMKMGINETDIQQSINKLVEMEIKKAREDYDNQIIDEPDGYIFVDVTGNEIEPLKHPQYVTDHHLVAHHEESRFIE